MKREPRYSMYAARSPLVMTFPDLLEFFLRRWKVIAGAAALSTAAVVWFVLQATPIYSATTQILLEVPSENVFGNDRVIAQRSLGSEIVDSQIIVLRSSALLSQVIETLNLNKDPDFLTPSESWIDVVAGWLSGSARKSPASESVQNTTGTVTLLTKAISVSRVGTSNVIEVSAKSSTAEKAATLANTVADAYVADQVEARHERARRASIWLNERMTLQRHQLEASESAVEKFKIEHNLIATREGSITEQQLSELNLGLISAQAEVAEKQSRYIQVERLLREGDDLQNVPDVLKSSAVSDLRGRRAEVARTEADLLSKYGDRHPELTRIRNELREMDRQIQAEVERVVVNLKNELEVAESRAGSLEAALASASGRSGTDNRHAVALRELERVAASDRELYESFLARARLAQEEASINIAEARIISPAHIPDNPTYPRKKLSAMLGLIFGLGAGVCGAAIMEVSRRGFLAEAALEEALHLPVLASLPKVDAWKRNNSYVVDDLASRQWWRYNAAIDSMGIGADAVSSFEGNASLIHVTSALPGEGKTTLAISLAVAAAASGHRVILIDGDLHRSAMTKAFGLTDKVGLVDVLGFAADPGEAIHLNAKTGVQVIPAGARSKLQAALLGSHRMRSLLLHLQSMFDVVIIDSPPVAVAIDAEIISSLAEQVILAVRWNHTGRETIERAVRKLKAKEGKINIVLTMVDEQQLPRYGRYASLEARAMEKYYSPR